MFQPLFRPSEMCAKKFEHSSILEANVCVCVFALHDHMTNQTWYYVLKQWMVIGMKVEVEVKYIEWNLESRPHRSWKIYYIWTLEQSCGFYNLATFYQNSFETGNICMCVYALLKYIMPVYSLCIIIIILSTLIYISLCVHKLCKAHWRRLALKSQLKIIETNVMGASMYRHKRTRALCIHDEWWALIMRARMCVWYYSS